jgi:hypothetical protein
MDAIYLHFLENTFAEAQALVSKSDVLHLTALPPHPPASYLAEFRVDYLMRKPSGTVARAHGSVLTALHFPEDYLRSTDPRLSMKVASLLGPPWFVHPNVRSGVICLGAAFAPGTGIGLLLREIYEIVSYSCYTLVETNSLDPEACRLLRANPEILASFHPAPFIRRDQKLQIRVSEA